MKIRTPRAVVIAAGLALAASSASAQFFDIPVDQGLTEGISDNGVASGSFGFGDQYFMWTQAAGSMQIGGVAPGNGVGGQGKISNDGRYISGTTFNAAQNWHEMSRYDTTTGTWEGFGKLPGIGTQIDAEVSSGWNISGDGRSVVGLGWTSLGTADAHASQWTEGVGLFSLGSNAVGESSRANAVNFDGSVVAGWQDGAGRQGSVWVNGTQELIFNNNGDAAQEASDVSGDGQWVSGFGIGGFFSPGNAYRYNTVTDTYEDIPNLASGAERNMAGAGITDDGGTIVGGTWGFGPAFFGNAFIWRDGIGTVDMPTYLDSLGIAYPTGFHFSFASAISSDGEWITGWGDLGGPGNTQSWVVHIPAPATLPMLGLAGLVAVRRRR